MKRARLVEAALCLLVTALPLAAQAQPLQPIAHLVGNAALQALPPSTSAAVVRDGYAGAGDAPPLTYNWGSGACAQSSNGRSDGDGGVEVKATGGGCWRAMLPSAGLDVREWGAKCDKATDDSAAINNAIAAASRLAHAISIVTPAGLDCSTGSTIQLASNVTLEVLGEMTWIGDASGPMFATSSARPTNDTGVTGPASSYGVIDPGSILSGDIFDINGGWGDRFTNLKFRPGAKSVIVFDIRDTLPPAPANNAAFDTVENITSDITASVGGGKGWFGEVIRLQGNPAGSMTGVTDNEFRNVRFSDVQTACVDLVGPADTNLFYDVWCLVTGAGGAGVVFNSGAPSAENDVNTDNFYHFAADFAGPATTSGHGFVVNNSHSDIVFDAEFAGIPASQYLAGGSTAYLTATIVNPADATHFVRYFPGVETDYGSDLIVGGVHESPSAPTGVSACTGLGAGGVCAFERSPSASRGIIRLTAGGAGISSGGQLTLTLPPWSANIGDISCILTAADGSGAWTFPVGLRYVGASATAINLFWSNGSALSSGSYYFINYDCKGY